MRLLILSVPIHPSTAAEITTPSCWTHRHRKKRSQIPGIGDTAAQDARADVDRRARTDDTYKAMTWCYRTL